MEDSCLSEGLACGQTYTVTVVATNALCNSSDSDEVTFTQRRSKGSVSNKTKIHKTLTVSALPFQHHAPPPTLWQREIVELNRLQ